jgi:hypothetical protein
VVRAPWELALRSIGLASAVVAFAGCLPGGAPRDHGIALSPPSSWRPAAAATWMVPGTPLLAWSGPEDSSLVVYRTLPIPHASAAMLAEAAGNRLESLPQTRLLVKQTETIGGVAAARVEAIAPGTGDALAPSGLGAPVAPDGKPLFPTRQVMLVFARPGETICVRWHLPERAHERIAPEIEDTVKSLKFDSRGKQQTQRY